MTRSVSRRAALATAGAALAPPVLTAAEAPHPDAELFRAIAGYLAASRDYSLRGGRNGPGDGALWAAVEAAQEALDAVEPTTMDGVRALAKLAEHEATSHPGHTWSDSYTGDLPARVCQAVLRLTATR